MEKNKPVKVFRDGIVNASIFEKEVENKNKEKFISKSVSLQISYKDKENKWVNKSITILKSNLGKVINVLDKTESYLEESKGK